MTYTNQEILTSSVRLRLKLHWFVYLILNRVTFTRITKVPKYLPNRVYIKFYVKEDSLSIEVKGQTTRLVTVAWFC